MVSYCFISFSSVSHTAVLWFHWNAQVEESNIKIYPYPSHGWYLSVTPTIPSRKFWFSFILVYPLQNFAFQPPSPLELLLTIFGVGIDIFWTARYCTSVCSKYCSCRSQSSRSCHSAASCQWPDSHTVPISSFTCIRADGMYNFQFCQERLG